MSTLMARLRRRDDAGFSLPELLVVLVMTSLLGGFVLAGIVRAFDSQRQQVDRTTRLIDAKVVFERMTRNIRQANPLQVAENDRLQLLVTIGTVQRTLTYTVSTVSGVQRLSVTEVRDDLSDATAAVTTTEVLLDELSNGSEDVFKYIDETGSTLPHPGGVYVEDDARGVIVRLRLAVTESDSPIDLYQRLTLRNTE